MNRISAAAALATLCVVASCGDATHTPTDLQNSHGPQPGGFAAAITVTPSPTGATVDTDKDDYAPGETVIITGAGWAAGETIDLNLAEAPVADGPHDWQVTADADGRFTDSSFSPGTEHLGVLFTLTATGPVSGSAQATFTDGNVTGASTPSVRESSCTTTQSTFPLGSSVCARTTITVQTPPAGDGDFRFEWVSPSDAIERTAAASGANASSHDDTYTPASAGVWTVRICKPSGNCGSGGNLLASATFTIEAPPTDNTPPSIAPVITGTVGNDGWYTSDVTLSWSVQDLESSITSTTGCGPVTITADQAATDYTCSATSAGGTDSETVSIKRDATAPVISPNAATTSCSLPGSNGWCRGTQTAGFTASDATSGLADASKAAFTVQSSTDGAAVHIASGAVCDNAGNCNPGIDGGPFSIDATAPTASASRTPAANTHGWNNTDVTVSFSGSDALSGIDSCTAPITVSSEGAGQSASGTCTDVAGNVSASADITGINIDKTAPTASASASPAPNAAGWNNTDVTVSFSGSDALSGIDSCSAAVTLSGEGTGQSASGTCTDKAGNESAAASATGIDIDKTAPTGISFIGGPADGASYYWGSVPAAPTCTADGAISGLKSCNVSGYGTAVGSPTMTATATDNADNQGTATRTYTVLAWTLDGFFAPVKMGALNTAKSGSTVPLKFRIFAGAWGENEQTSTAAVKSFVVQTQNCELTTELGAEEQIDQYTTGGTVLRYDAKDGQFIQNWQTPKGAAGRCYKVTLTTQDGSTQFANFKLK